MPAGSIGRQNGLDEIYTRILHVVLTGEDSNDQTMTDLFRGVVGLAIMAPKPLSIIALGRLIEVEIADIRWLLESLFSVMETFEDDNGSIELLHPSSRRFLFSSQRCCDHRFWIDEKQANSILFGHCLEIISDTLRRDICGLETPAAEITETDSKVVEKFLSEHVQRAGSYGADHF